MTLITKPLVVLPSSELELRLLDAIRVELAKKQAFVCFSGGVDSSVVLAACVRAGMTTTALLAVSPSLAALERTEAHRVAVEIGAPLIELRTQELSLAEYRANTGDRCYHCKSTLYREAIEVAFAHVGRFGRLLSGTHMDDLGEHRPGLAAGRESGVLSPLVTAGFNKRDVRKVAHHWGLSNASKPAMPCLASRIPIGTEVTAERLRQVEQVEQFLRLRGIWPARARWREDEVIIEVPPDLLESAETQVFCDELERTCAEAGFGSVSIIQQAALRR